jgi:hypothetical protein
MIPTSEAADPDAVQHSLAQARSELERGDGREALRHLRRAAEDADQAGRELRAVALARSAADLATEVGASVTPPPVREASSAVPLSMTRGSMDVALQRWLESGRAVKVLVKRSARDEELYVLRKADGGPPGLGAREAIIVLLEPDDGFFATPPATPASE